MSAGSVDETNPTYIYIGAFVDELQRAGVQHMIICPGSRSTPLALTSASYPAIHIWMHVDERSAAFFALGMAKRLRQPVALLCTSGTAAANFLPAVVEAKLTHIPLLVLTADRPHELRNCGAPQAIDQNQLYGTHVKEFVEVALPEATNAALRYIRTLANRAVALTLAIPAGPVHLNIPFREPLTPEPLLEQPLLPAEQRDAIAWYGRPNHVPYVAVSDASLGMISPAQVTHLATLASKARHGLIVVGPHERPALARPLLQLAQRLGYPILADPLSQMRCGEHNYAQVISSYDAFLRVTSLTEHLVPQLVLRFGAMPTSKSLLLYLQHDATCPHVIIDGQSGWNEPTQFAAEVVHVDEVAFCHTLLSTLDVSCNPPDHTWLTTWQHADQVTQQALHAAIQDFKQPFEGRIFTELAEILPEGATLYVGNSMPVRDLDTFFWGKQRSLRIVANRGANGIDGVISSALGFSTASPKSEPVILVIGDLSFYHDLNGLLAAHLHHLNLTIVLVNNDGGGIFSFLPQSTYSEHFEHLFGTPTGLDFRPVVQMYGGKFQRAETWQDFHMAVDHALTLGGLHVVEVATQRSSNVSMHRHLWHIVEQAVACTSGSEGLKR